MLINRINKNLISIIIILLVFSINTSSSFAHKMSIKELQPGEIGVYYANGTSPSSGEVILYSEDYIELYKGDLEADGTFQYPTEIGAHLMVVMDTLGHKAKLKIGEDTSQHSHELPLAILVSSIFFIFAFVFHNRLKLKKKIA